MRRSIRLFATAVVLTAPSPALASAQSLAFSPVTVVDVREGVARSGMTVVVTGDRITAAGPADQIAIPPSPPARPGGWSPTTLPRPS